jgi:hypothetical protein
MNTVTENADPPALIRELGVTGRQAVDGDARHGAGS